MVDLFGATKARKPSPPVTPGIKVRRAVWRAIRETNRADLMVPAGPIAEKLKMPAAEVVRLWLTEGYRLAYCRLGAGETPDFWGMDHETIRAILERDGDPGAILLGVDGE